MEPQKGSILANLSFLHYLDDSYKMQQTRPSSWKDPKNIKDDSSKIPIQWLLQKRESIIHLNIVSYNW